MTRVAGSSSDTSPVGTKHAADRERSSQRWLTVAEVANYLGISRTSVTRLKQLIPWVKAPGVGVRFRLDDVERFLDEHRVVPPTVRPARHVIRAATAVGDDVEVVPGLTRRQLREKAGF